MIRGAMPSQVIISYLYWRDTGCLVSTSRQDVLQKLPLAVLALIAHHEPGYVKAFPGIKIGTGSVGSPFVVVWMLRIFPLMFT